MTTDRRIDRKPVPIDVTSAMMFNPDTLLSRTFSDSSLQTLFPHLLFLFPEFILHDGCNFSAIFVICQELLLKFCYNFEKP